MRVHSISEVNMLLKGLIEKNPLLRGILVRGEISNFKKYPGSGHCYFTLKDENAALKCVMFKSWARFMRFLPQNGMKVIAAGDISVYERDGVYQLYVNNLQPDGVGALAVAYEQLKQKLEQEGLFAAERKQNIPAFPNTIGVVTSESGAVLHDIYTVTKRRAPQVRLVLYPVAVQGDGASARIAEAIAFFNKKYPVDVLIVGRGGGSAEDLWAFNEEKTVRAIAASKIPVISAVGHETDVSLADFAADVRAATPSQAAELAVPDVKVVKYQLQALQQRLQHARQTQLAQYRQRAEQGLKYFQSKTPQLLLSGDQQKLDMLMEELHKKRQLLLDGKKKIVEADLQKLELLSPVHILRRGYGLLEKQGRIIKSVQELQTGDMLRLKLHDGSAVAEVKETQENNANF